MCDVDGRRERKLDPERTVPDLQGVVDDIRPERLDHAVAIDDHGIGVDYLLPGRQRDPDVERCQR